MDIKDMDLLGYSRPGLLKMMPWTSSDYTLENSLKPKCVFPKSQRELSFMKDLSQDRSNAPIISKPHFIRSMSFKLF